MDNITKRPNAPPEATKNWSPFVLEFDRVIKKVNVEEGWIEIDAAITTAIEARYGGGYVYKYDSNGRISHCGLENLAAKCILAETALWKPNQCIKKDVCECELHLDRMVLFENAEHCWVRNLYSHHFGFHTWIKRGAKVSRFIVIMDHHVILEL